MQLRDLSIENGIKVINIKSCLAYEDYLESLKSCDYDTLKEGVNTLIDVEQEFFLISEIFLDSVIEIISIYNDETTLKKLINLKNVPIKIKDRKKDIFLDKEYLKRDIFNYEDYLELLELDDLLIRETNYHYLLGNPYILHSISYIKKEFSDYYSINRKADNYLFTILNILEKREYYDTEEVSSILKLFSDREDEKIITFAKKI